MRSLFKECVDEFLKSGKKIGYAVGKCVKLFTRDKFVFKPPLSFSYETSDKKRADKICKTIVRIIWAILILGIIVVLVKIIF